jgi:hypothetical protein
MGISWLQSRAVPVILYGVRPRRIPAQRPIVLRIALFLLALFLLLLGVTACGPSRNGRSGPAAAAVLRSDQATERARVFLISPGDQGRSGHKVGCGDSAVPVEIALPRKEPGLEEALGALLALKERYQEPSGLSNPLYSSALQLVRIERHGGEARVYLKGYLEMGDACDNPRMLAELEETARQFPDVSRVQFFLEERPLREILAGKGSGKG